LSSTTSTTSTTGSTAESGSGIAGLDWSKPQAVDPAGLVAISCPVADFCLATDQSGDSLTYDGTSWSKPAPIGTSGVEVTDISCVSRTFCAATVDQGSELVVYVGSHFGTPASPDSTGYEFNSVSCANVGFCVAVGDSLGNASTYNGTSWGALGTIDPGGNLTSISCPTGTFCATIDLNADAVNVHSASAVMFNGGVWSQPIAMPDQFGDGQDLSCASPKLCVAIDNSGDASVYGGRSWGTPDPIDGTSSATVLGAVPGQTIGVSCTKPSFCVAVDGNGNAVGYDNGNWGPPGPIDAGHQLNAVSCASPTFCAAVDLNGNVIVGT
jgi:hypothetical protein